MPALTPEQEALKAAAIAATPGPWFANESTEALHAVRGKNGRIVADVGYSGSLDRDAENAVYLAAANPAAILAILDQLEAVQAVPEHIKYRWNIERQTDGSLLICENDHEKGEKCEYMRYVPSTHQPVQAVPDAALQKVREALETYYKALTARLHGGSAQADAIYSIEQAMGMTWMDWVAAQHAAAAPGDPAQ